LIISHIEDKEPVLSMTMNSANSDENT